MSMRMYTLIRKNGSGRNPERYTPAWLMARASMFLGYGFLDPCPASARESGQTDGLAFEWTGRVWLNPPYGVAMHPWLHKALSDPVDEILMLLPAATDTQWFAPLWEHSICFIQGRIKFVKPDGKLGSIPIPTVLIYRGPRVLEFADTFSILGPIVHEWR